MWCRVRSMFEKSTKCSNSVFKIIEGSWKYLKSPFKLQSLKIALANNNSWYWHWWKFWHCCYLEGWYVLYKNLGPQIHNKLRTSVCQLFVITVLGYIALFLKTYCSESSDKDLFHANNFGPSITQFPCKPWIHCSSLPHEPSIQSRQTWQLWHHDKGCWVYRVMVPCINKDIISIQ